MNDGADWNKINFQSVTEQNSLDEFLTTAELAGTDFEAGVCVLKIFILVFLKIKIYLILPERLNIKFVSKPRAGILSTEERTKIKTVQDQHRSYLRIPRRLI